MTLPDKPMSRHQRYRRTSRGEAFVEQTKGKTKKEEGERENRAIDELNEDLAG